MVDFQERDTTRVLGSDDEDDGADDADAGRVDAEAGRVDAGAGRDDAEAGSDVAEAGGDDAAAGDAASETSGPTSPEDAPEPAGDVDVDGESASDHHAHDVETVSIAVLTISDSRTIDDDPAGDAIVEAVDDAAHEVVVRNLVGDDYDTVQSEVDTLTRREDVEAVVTTGGTGVAPRDVTVEAVRPLFEKELPGFGEVFRALSREEIGTRVVATRALAGLTDGVPVFCLPGSEDAARLGAREVVVPEVGHLVGLATRSDDDTDPLTQLHGE